MTDAFAQWRQTATPVREPADVCFDREALQQLHEALEAFGSLKQSAAGMLDTPEKLQAQAERVKELDATVQAATRRLWFTKIPSGEWRAIEEQHPATDAQRELDPKQTIDPDTFEPAIVSACCADPGLTVDEATWLRDFLPIDEWEQTVLAAVHKANKAGSSVPKGVSGIADRLISELRSTTPPSEGSRSPSSEGE